MPPARDATSVEQARTAVAGIGERYRQKVVGQLGVLDRAVASLADGSLDDGLRRQAEREAHKLGGTAGTFGFEQVSRRARELEVLLAGAVGPAQHSRARALLDGIRTGLAIPPADAPATRGDDEPTLLVVDADAGLAGRLAAEVEAAGLQAEIAGDTVAARAAIALLGIVPDRATETLDLLRQLGAADPPVPTLVWTDGEGLMDRVEVARLGGRGFLPRTAPLAQVREAVGDLLDRQRSGGHTVLAVDDDPVVLEVLAALLQTSGMRVVALSDPGGFWDAVTQVAPDLVILDVDLPGVSGVELCRVLRNDRRWAQLPVLFLTGHTDSATVHQVFASGADDFVAKPIVGPELVTRITNRLERVQLFRRLAETDGLTGVANRRRSTEMLEHFLGMARRFGQPLSLALLDLDHFKQVNDRFGHATGDRVLQGLGGMLSQFFRGEDVVARWGGEEFLVGMHGMSRLDGLHRLGDFLEAVREERFTGPSGTGLRVSFSAGVAQYPDDGRDLPALYRAADQALYQAKREGRNRVRAAAGRGCPEGWVDVAVAVADAAPAARLLDALSTRGHSTRWLRDGAAALAGQIGELAASVVLLDQDLAGTGALGGAQVLVVREPVQVAALMWQVRLALRASRCA